MAWTLLYKTAALKQLKKLERPVAQQIVDLLERMASSGTPRSEGKAMTGVWQGSWRYRVGSYRVICILREGELVVEVVRAGHRKDVYR